MKITIILRIMAITGAGCLVFFGGYQLGVHDTKYKDLVITVDQKGRIVQEPMPGGGEVGSLSPVTSTGVMVPIDTPMYHVKVDRVLGSYQISFTNDNWETEERLLEYLPSLQTSNVYIGYKEEAIAKAKSLKNYEA